MYAGNINGLKMNVGGKYEDNQVDINYMEDVLMVIS